MLCKNSEADRVVRSALVGGLQLQAVLQPRENSRLSLRNNVVLNIGHDSDESMEQ